ncbi:MAG: hypothetical protein WC299_01870, partial [Kiritimatiellia bacterium]
AQRRPGLRPPGNQLLHIAAGYSHGKQRQDRRQIDKRLIIENKIMARHMPFMHKYVGVKARCVLNHLRSRPAVQAARLDPIEALRHE